MIYLPYPYQRYCGERIVREAALGLFLDMGMGKTVITLDAIYTLRYDRWVVEKVLIIAPKKVAEGAWSTESQKWEHLRRLRISVAVGSRQKRLQALAAPADVYVINRDNVAWLVEHFRQDWPFDMVVLDESSSFKNSQSKRFKALKLVRGRIKRLVELSGTPSANGLMDLWAQIYLLDGGKRLGRTLGQYRERFFEPDKRNRTQIFSYKPKKGSLEHIQKAIGDICISLKAEDYLNLPDLIFDDVPVVLDGPAQKAYRRLERDMLLQTEDGQITAASAAVLTNKLLQLCNGAVYDVDRQPLLVHDCKVEAFLETLEKLNGQNCLVFYSFCHDRDRLLAALAATGLRVREYQSAADGEAWNAGEVDVLLAHPQSCAYGLNLQAGGRHIVWFGLTWSLELYEQANKRLHRQGQEHPVIVHHLVVQGSMDEDVIKSLRTKGGAQQALLAALQARIDTVRHG